MYVYIPLWIAAAAVVIIVFLRLLKRGKRRCCGKYTNKQGELVDCGSFNIKTAHFILMPPEEPGLLFPMISPTASIPKKIVSWRHPIATIRWYVLSRIIKGVPRLFVRRTVKITIRHHELKEYEHKWIVVEKIDRSATSLFHLWWTKRFDRKQFDAPEMEYQLAILDLVKPLLKNMRPPVLGARMTDTPDMAEGIMNDLRAILWEEDE